MVRVNTDTGKVGVVVYLTTKSPMFYMFMGTDMEKC